MDTVIKWIVPINQTLKFPIEAKKGSMIVEYIQFDYLSSVHKLCQLVVKPHQSVGIPIYTHETKLVDTLKIFPTNDTNAFAKEFEREEYINYDFSSSDFLEIEVCDMQGRKIDDAQGSVVIKIRADIVT